MKIIIIGATGTIGQAVIELFRNDHDVMGVSRSSTPSVDLQDSVSIEKLISSHQDADAILCVAGDARFGTLDHLSDDDFAYGLSSKLMGQVNVVRSARKYLKDGAVVIITTGILAQNPNPASSMVTMINLGLEGFVKAASLDMPQNQKLHAVSPPLALETSIKMGWGANGVPSAEIAKLYKEALLSEEQGQVFSFQ